MLYGGKTQRIGYGKGGGVIRQRRRNRLRNSLERENSDKNIGLYGRYFFFFMDREGYDWTMCVYVPRLCRNGNLTININVVVGIG